MADVSQVAGRAVSSATRRPAMARLLKARRTWGVTISVRRASGCRF
jgi:hypothetical protein